MSTVNRTYKHKKDGNIVTFVYHYPNKKDNPNYIDPRIKLTSRYSKGIRRLILKHNNSCSVCGTTENLWVTSITNPTQISDHKVICPKCRLRMVHNVLFKHKHIIELRKQGNTLQEIADIYHVSRQRIWDILQRNKIFLHPCI